MNEMNHIDHKILVAIYDKYSFSSPLYIFPVINDDAWSFAHLLVVTIEL